MPDTDANDEQSSGWEHSAPDSCCVPKATSPPTGQLCSRVTDNSSSRGSAYLRAKFHPHLSLASTLGSMLAVAQAPGRIVQFSGMGKSIGFNSDTSAKVLRAGSGAHFKKAPQICMSPVQSCRYPTAFLSHKGSSGTDSDRHVGSYNVVKPAAGSIAASAIPSGSQRFSAPLGRCGLRATE